MDLLVEFEGLHQLFGAVGGHHALVQLFDFGDFLRQDILAGRLGSESFESDQQFQRLLENRQKYLTQQVVQEQNKVIGRLGATPLQEQGV